MNCDKCKYYHWYCDWCAKWDCKVNERAVCNCFEEAKPPKDSRKKRQLKQLIYGQDATRLRGA